MTPEKVPTHIVDYSSQEQNEEALRQEIGKAHVVCVVYSLNDEDALDKLKSYWLPLIKHCTEGPQSKPVILAGNKADLPYDMDAHSEKLSELLDECTEVETGIECSAKELLNVSELFYFAQKAVLHPTAPLFSPSSQQLKPDCEEALKRIFRISDINNDGFLDDIELNEFQIRCFNAPLQPQALQDIKNVVMKTLPNGVVDEGLTMEGFIFLHQLFIQRGRHETTWKVLRKFGYSNDLTLREDYLQPPFEVHPDCSVELSPSGLRFLKEIFKKYDKDGDGALSSSEQQDMHNVCPSYPWDEQLVGITVETNKKGWVTMNGFLAFWILQTSHDYLHTLEYLAMMGYSSLVNGNLITAIEEVQFHDKRKSVYRCKVFGSRRSGKTTIVRGLVGKHQVQTTPDEEEMEAVSIKSLPIAGRQMHLILHEASLVTDLQVLNEKIEQVEAICLLYDISAKESFRFAADLYSSIKNLTATHLPCLFVGTKVDSPPVAQNYHKQPKDFIEESKLLPAKYTSIKSLESYNSVYIQLLAIAMDPSKGVRSSSSFPEWLKYVGIGLAVCVCIGTISYLFTPSSKQLPTVSTS